MRNYLTLTAILFKNTYDMLDSKKHDRKNTKVKSIALVILLIIAFLPTIGMIFYLINTLFVTFSQLNQQSFIVMLALHVQSLVVFIFAMFMVPAVFYFAKDIETLLPLPLKPSQIIMAKFTVTLLYEYITAFFILGPLFVSMCINGHLSVGFILMAIIIFITAPILPLIYSVIINMIVIGILHFGKNRDFFNMMAGIFGLVIALAISMGSQNLVAIDPEEVVKILGSGDNSLVNILGSIFFNMRFGAEAMVSLSIIDILIYLGINALAIVVFNLLAEVLYFKGVIGITESSSKHKKINAKEFTKSTVKQSSLVSYVIKEMRILVRTPSYFLNCILSSLIMPVFFIVPILFSGNGSEIVNLISTIDFENSSTLRIVMAVFAALGFFLGCMNFITSSAISREGQNYYFMKYIPMSYTKQLNAKALTGVLVSMVGVLLLEIVVAVFVKIPLWSILLGFALSFASIIIISYLGLVADSAKPNLIWDNEQKAVKNNINGVFTMFGGYALTAAIIFLGIFVKIDPVLFGVLLLAILTAISFFTYKFSINFCVKAVQKL